MTTAGRGLVDRLRAAGCVFAEEEAQLLTEAAAGVELEALVTRRVAGEPLEQVLGWARFDGHRIAVRPGVFVPRRRTEALIAESARVVTNPRRVGASCQDSPSSRRELTVVDLCCGSGALGSALVRRLVAASADSAVAVEHHAVELHAADLLPEAVACAEENLAGLGQVYQGDLFDALPGRLRGQVDVLLANVPYVPTEEIALLPGEARDHEPLATLDGGPDGLDLARRVVEGAGEWLAPGGSVFLEASEEQGPVLAACLEERGLVSTVTGSVVRGFRGGTPPGRRAACRR